MLKKSKPPRARSLERILDPPKPFIQFAQRYLNLSEELITTLEQQGDVRRLKTPRPGSAHHDYQLIGGVNGGGEW